MNYLKIYCNLIRKAENRNPPEGYTEKHHIFPKSIFGKNNRVVVLTGREHYIAHALLEKVYIKRYGLNHKKTKKMSYAFWCMNSQKSKNKYINSYLYESSRYRIGGENNIAKDPTIRKKISEKNKGKNNPRYGKPLSKETKDKISKSLKGRVFSKESIEKMRTSKIGDRHPKSKLWRLTFTNGNCIVLCGLTTWAKENGYSESHIGEVYFGKYKKHKDIIKVEVISKEDFDTIAKDLPSEETMESIKKLMKRPSPWSEQ